MRLRIVLLEVREESGVGEVLESGRVVGHAVQVARQVERFEAVAVFPLVLASELAEVGRDAVGGDGPARDSGDSRGVVGADRERGIANRVVFRYDRRVP